MKKTLLTLSLCATLLGMMSAPARAIVLMDEDINISFSFSNNFNHIIPNTARETIDSTAMAHSGTHSLEEIHPEDLNVWGGQALTFEENLAGTAVVGAGADASAAERNLSQFDHNGKMVISWWYKIIDPVDLNSDVNPDNDTSPANVLPVSALSLRYNDGDNIDVTGALAPANEDLTVWEDGRTFNMIVDGEWHKAEVMVNVLSPAARAALDEGGNDDSDTITVWRMETDISKVQSELIGQSPSYAGAPSHFFIDHVEMTVVPIPEPATLGLLGLGCLMTALSRRRRA